MMRQLNLNEMEMVSGGGAPDSGGVPGGGGDPHGGDGVHGQVGGGRHGGGQGQPQQTSRPNAFDRLLCSTVTVPCHSDRRNNTGGK